MGLAMLVKKSHLNADQQEVADIIGLENYRALIEAFGGDRLYIPKARSIVPAAELANEVRRRRQNGDSTEQIARELEMPAADIRRIK